MAAPDEGPGDGAKPGSLPDARGMPAYVVKKYDQASSVEFDNRQKAMEDQLFSTGEPYQWNSEAQNDRLKDGRPVMTINRIPQFIKQVTGDIRLNKPAIKVKAAGGKASRDIAKVYTGLIRHIEQASDADTSYIGAVEDCCRCGMGYWRVTTQYSNDDAFDLDIRIKRIMDPFSVLFDPGAKEFDRSDARWCIVSWMMDKDEFRQKYPGKSLTGFPADGDGVLAPAIQNLADWFQTDAIRVAEFWVKVRTKRTLYLLSDGEVIGDDDTTLQEVEEYIAQKNAAMVAAASIEMPGAQPRPPVAIKKTREVTTDKVMQYIVSGADQLEEPTEWAGKYIPIIGVWGEEVHAGDQLIRKGMVRDVKDPQRIYNYMRSANVEVLALQPKQPWIVQVDHIRGEFKSWWDNAGKKNYPYLPYNPAPDGSKPERSQPPLSATGLMAEGAAAIEDMYGTTGIYAASLGARSNETSGVAIARRQHEGDVGSYLYVDNLSKAIAYCGRQLVDLIPKIYDTERQVRILQENGDEDIIFVNKTVMGPDGSEKLVNDITVGEYDVVVSSGPAFSTRREEAAATLTELVRSFPQAGPILGDVLVGMYDLPDSEKIANRLKKLLPPGIDDPGPPPPPQPDPAQVAEQQKIEADMAKTQMDMEDKQAQRQLEREKMGLEREKMQAERFKIVADHQSQRSQFEEADKNRKHEARSKVRELANTPMPQAEGGEDGDQEEVLLIQALMQSNQQTQAMIAQTQTMMGGLMQVVQSMAEAQLAPKRVVYDANGRPAGVEPVVN